MIIHVLSSPLRRLLLVNTSERKRKEAGALDNFLKIKKKIFFEVKPVSSTSANYLSCNFFSIFSYAFRVTSAYFFREFYNTTKSVPVYIPKHSLHFAKNTPTDLRIQLKKKLKLR